MNFLKKAISVAFIAAIAVIDVKIIVDYEIIRPTEKYNIVQQEKTVAEILDLSTIHPEEILSSTSEETVEKSNDEKQVEQVDNNEESAKADQKNDTHDSDFSNENNVEESKEKSVEQPIEEQTQPEESKLETTIEEEPSSTNSNNIVETAKSYLGSNYVSGGSSPSTGFDCSGFTQYVYGLYGISLNRTASDQADNGTPINKEELQPGDLLLFSYYGSDSIGHTGIYIGDGKFVHAANSSRGVVEDTIESGYYLENYVSARRVN